MINNILIEVLSSMAEQERINIKKRQREGVAAAKKKGKHLGRPKYIKPDNFEMVIMEWRDGKITAKKAYEKLGLSKSSF